MTSNFLYNSQILPSNVASNLYKNLSAVNGTDFAMYGSLLDKMRTQSLYLLGLGIGTMILCYFQIAFWLMPSEKQTREIRKQLFESILRQDIGWFDTYKSEELNNRLTEDVNKIKDGIGDKLGNGIQYVSTFFISVIISFARGWKLTLVILSISPLLFISSFLFTKVS